MANALTFSENKSSVLVLIETEEQQYFQLFDQTRIMESVIQNFPVVNISLLSIFPLCLGRFLFLS